MLSTAVPTALTFFFLGPVGAIIAAGAAFTVSEIGKSHLRAKQDAGSTAADDSDEITDIHPTVMPPTGYRAMDRTPPKAVLKEAETFLGKPMGSTRKFLYLHTKYLFRIERNPIDGSEPVVTIYEGDKSSQSKIAVNK